MKHTQHLSLLVSFGEYYNKHNIMPQLEVPLEAPLEVPQFFHGWRGTPASSSDFSLAMRKSHLTLIILDPSDVQKPYANKMQYLSKVWDGSKGEVGDNLGFWGCMAVACQSGGRRPIPLHFKLWSADSP